MVPARVAFVGFTQTRLLVKNMVSDASVSSVYCKS